MKRLIIAAAVLAAATSSAVAFSLSDLQVKSNVEAGKRYRVTLKYQGDDPNVQKMCFSWNGEGPYCWPDHSLNRRKNEVSIVLQTNNPGQYTLSGYIVQKDGSKSNTVSAKIKVR